MNNLEIALDESQKDLIASGDQYANHATRVQFLPYGFVTDREGRTKVLMLPGHIHEQAIRWFKEQIAPT